MVNSHSPQTTILIAFFTLSGAVSINRYGGIGPLEWLAAGLIAMFALAVAIPLIRWLPFCSPESGRIDRSVLALIFAIVVSLISLEVAIDAVSDFAALTAAVMLRDAQPYLPMLLLIIPACIICRRAKGILKFSTLAFLFGVPIFSVLFFASFDTEKMKNVLTTLTFSLDKLPLAYTNFAFASLVLICAKKAGALSSGNAFWGAALGGGASAIVCMQVITVLGSAYADSMNYPYAAAVSAITLGGAMARPDGLGYTLAVLCQIVRLSVAGGAFTAVAEPFFGERRLPNLLFFILTAVFCVILGSL